MEEYIILLKILLYQEYYTKYRQSISNSFIENNYPDLYRLYKCLDSLFENNIQDYTVVDLKFKLQTLYPKITLKAFEGLFEALDNCVYNRTVVEEYLKASFIKRIAFDIAEKALHVNEGRSDIESLYSLLQEAKEKLDGNTVIKNSEEEFVTDDLEVLYQGLVATPGLRWRLACLNKSLGSLRKGNFGFIFGRPESGKSTFLASEGTYMATQLSDDQGPVIWFDNEEEGKGIQTRIYQAALGITSDELWADLHGNKKKYYETLKGKMKLISDAALNRKRIEAVCRAFKPSLIFINQLDKVRGFAADRPDLVLKDIYQWARELSKQYGPVIGVCQAGSSGENKKWLYMDDVDGSHTAKQGEADWILGIGQYHDIGHDQVRYFNLSKNKLLGDPDTDPQLRHGKLSAIIVPEKALYRDFND